MYDWMSEPSCVESRCDVMIVVESQQVGIDFGKCPCGTPQECAAAVGHRSCLSLLSASLSAFSLAEKELWRDMLRWFICK